MSLHKQEMKAHRTASPKSSCVSLRSNNSRRLPPDLSGRSVIFDSSTTRKRRRRTGSPFPDHMSLKSNNSRRLPPDLRGRSAISESSTTSDSRKRKRAASPVSSHVSNKRKRGDLNRVVKERYAATAQKCKWDSPAKKCRRGFQQSVNSHKQYTCQPVDDVLQRVKETHKTSMKNKFESLFEGIQENKTLLNKIYTQLYIIEGESEGVNEEHEVIQIQKTPRTQTIKNTSISCNDIFDPLPEPGCEEETIESRVKMKTVLTKGIAGIGKTVSAQKFILDWAEGKANQDIDFMFVLPFRELNLIKDEQYSLHKLLLDFHPELIDLDSNFYDECKVVFIFDGLDESRIKLFSNNKKFSNVTKSSSVVALMSNLIKGELLPSALIWITSRPAAANQIPSKYINRVTEIQGFIDSQKEEYIMKRISDQHQARKIISHIKSTRSLHIMCHIPVFCWISATVLQDILKQDDSAEIPKTLTEMYIHFLLIQINMRNQKYNKKNKRDLQKLLQSNREVIVKLAELAFKQLMKGNVMFYEEDLRECGIDITEASVYSGICTEIFKEESVIHHKKVYRFIHLSFQEFLAAFYVFYSYVVPNKQSLRLFLFGENGQIRYTRISLYTLLRETVNKTLLSENGHLDLFLRFLLGISMETNQQLLQALLTHTESSLKDSRQITKYIKGIITGHCTVDSYSVRHCINDVSADKSINLFFCLLEMNDKTLCREIQAFLESEKYTESKLSAAHCSAIAYMLQVSEDVLDEFDLNKYNTTDEGRRRLVPAVMSCRKALLVGCKLNDESCESVAAALQLPNSLLRELDMSYNDLMNSGIKRLSAGLMSPHCQLEILRLSRCGVTEEGCSYLASALESNPTHLRELDLSYNVVGKKKLFSVLLRNPDCKLKRFNTDNWRGLRITANPLKYTCDLTQDPNTSLVLCVQPRRTRNTEMKSK